MRAMIPRLGLIGRRPRRQALDEPEIERHFPREDEPPPVAHLCDGRACLHPPGRHPDGPFPYSARQNDARVLDNLHVIELHDLRTPDHDPALGLAQGNGEAPYAPLGGTRVRAVRERSKELRRTLHLGRSRGQQVRPRRREIRVLHF